MSQPQDRYKQTKLREQLRKPPLNETPDRLFFIRADDPRPPLICTVCGDPIVPLTPTNELGDVRHIAAVMHVVDGEKRYKHRPDGCAAVRRHRRALRRAQ